MSKAIDVINNQIQNERNINKDIRINEAQIESQFMLYDKEMINDTIKKQIELLQIFQDKKANGADGKLKQDVKKKIISLRANAICFSSTRTLSLLGLFTNLEYAKAICDIDDNDSYFTLVLGIMVLVSMRQDINPHITCNVKSVLMNYINDYSMDKERKIIDICNIINKKLNVNISYE